MNMLSNFSSFVKTWLVRLVLSFTKAVHKNTNIVEDVSKVCVSEDDFTGSEYLKPPIKHDLIENGIWHETPRFICEEVEVLKPSSYNGTRLSVKYKQIKNEENYV